MSDSYYLTEERELVRNAVREFVDNEVRPLATKIDNEDYFPVELFERLGELGYIDINIPEEYGGSNMDLTTHCVIVEELAKASASLAMSFVAHTGLATTIVNVLGTPEQKAKWLPGMVAGKLIGAHCTTEDSGTGNRETFSTSAVEDGDGYRINGSKCFSTNIEAASLYIVEAVTGGPGVFSYFVIEKGTPGFSIGEIWDKVGWRGSNTGVIHMDNVWVPKENLLGPINKGVELSPHSIFHEMISTGAVALGIVEEANRLTTEYLKKRMHGSGVPYPFRYDVMRIRMMENQAKENAIRGMTYPAALDFDAGKWNMVDDFLIKATCFKWAEEVCSTSIDLHGGVGVVKETGIERLWRDAKVGLIGGGQYDFLLSNAGAMRLQGMF